VNTLQTYSVQHPSDVNGLLITVNDLLNLNLAFFELYFWAMKRNVFTIIVILTVLALSGIIITQYFWVKDALNMQNEQFDQNANLGLKRVVNQLMVLQNDSSTAAKFMDLKDGQSYHTQFIQSLNPDLIKDMINAEFINLELCKHYYYGIYNKNNQAFDMISNLQYSHEILNSKHLSPISCIFQDDQFILAVYFPMQQQFVFNKMQFYILLSGLFMLIVIGGFWFTASSLLKQKKLSVMKTDFVNNMTHELKTPISTISVTSEMLMNDEIQTRPERVDKYANIIFKENQRLKNQVDQVLQVAMLDRKDYTLKLERVDTHELILQTVERLQITIRQRNGTIQQRLNAASSVVMADKNHLANIINNLLDNANKYSLQTPEIIISTHSNKKGLFITIQDKGIGIAEENQKHIFKKFQRIHTGNIHDVKGFGIGLYYVNSILAAPQ